MKKRWLPVVCAVILTSGLILTACAKEKDHDDDEGTSALITAPSSTPTVAGTTPTPTPTPTPAAAVAYTQDIQPIMTSSCTRCHSNFGTYSGIKTVVVAGSAASKLVTKTQSSGSMYTHLPADRATNAALIKTWVVNGAPENR